MPLRRIHSCQPKTFQNVIHHIFSFFLNHLQARDYVKRSEVCLEWEPVQDTKSKWLRTSVSY